MAGVAGRSGRKPNAEKYARPIAAAEKQIADRLPFLIDNMFKLADGVTLQEMTPDWPRIYTKAPDGKANEYLINRIMGKPTERHEHDIDSEIAELMAVLTAGRKEETQS